MIVRNGTAILVGAVATREDFDTAFNECNWLPRVTKVFNMLQIRPEEFGQSSPR